MKWYLIMNPGSRGGKSQRQFELIHKLFSKYNVDYDFTVTQSLEHAYELSVKANQSGYEVIVAVGGDGTINCVMNGFYNIDGERISKAKFGVIYTGTSPDFCKSYNIPLMTEQAVQALINGFVRQVSIGRIEFKEKVRYFACCANIGLGATLARYANSGIRKVLGDTAGTFLSLLKTLTVFKPIDIIINGQLFDKVYNVSVGKTFYIASGLKIKNALMENDYRFYVLKARENIVRLMFNMYSGKNLELGYETEITIQGTGEVEFDGDEGGELPCKISSAQALDLICGGFYDRKEIDRAINCTYAEIGKSNK